MIKLKNIYKEIINSWWIWDNEKYISQLWGWIYSRISTDRTYGNGYLHMRTNDGGGFNAHASCIFKPFWYSCTRKLNPIASSHPCPTWILYSLVLSHYLFHFPLYWKSKFSWWMYIHIYISTYISRDRRTEFGIGVSIWLNVPEVPDR